MENPLLEKNASTGHEIYPSTSLTSRDFQKPAESFMSVDRYHKAAALVDLAEDDVGLSEEVLEMPNFEQLVRLYFIDMRLNFLWALNLTALILINFFELPLWCSGPSSEPCGSRDDYYLGELPYLMREHSFYCEVATWIILTVHIFFPISYLGNAIFWRTKLNIFKVCLWGLLGLDILVFGLYAFASGPIVSLPFRFAPYLRVFVLIVDVRALRENMKTMVALSQALDILALFVLFLLFFSSLAFVLFEDTQQGEVYFSTYGNTLYQMFVLFTTSNNPDVWLPAYKALRASCLFFILYILFGVYFITNLILAVVYDSFKHQLAVILKERRARRKIILQSAFNLLDVERRSYLDIGQCICLFKAMNKYRTLPKVEEEYFSSVFYALDDSGDFKIVMDEFEDLCDEISLKFPKVSKPSYFARFPSCYDSVLSNKIKQFVKSRIFEYAIFIMLLVNLVAVIVETTLDLQNSSEQEFWQDVEFVLGWIYVVEMLLKIYSYGFATYWQNGLNKFDFTITCFIVIGETLTFVAPNSVSVISNEEWIRYLIIARLLRLLRLLIQIDRYRVIISTFLRLIPSSGAYLGMIFCLMCIYCSLGIQLYGGLVNSNNSDLENTSLYENDYLVHNFNDFSTGMVTLFELLVMGNWQIWLESYVILTGTWWTSIYFISFYALAVLFLLNIVVAFILEAFFTEMEISSSSVDLDTAHANEFEIQKYMLEKAALGRSGNVEFLLNRMLSSELEKMK